MREVKITFSVHGYIKQTVQLHNDCHLTAEEIEVSLADGKLVTTIQEDGTLDITENGQAIGQIVYVDNECEYEDYEVVESEPALNLALVQLGEVVRGFDCETGLPEATYNAVCNLVDVLMGNDSGTIFRKYIDATDGFFYLKEGTADDCWRDMVKAYRQ